MSIDVAQKLSIAEGTVSLYCARVTKAIRQLKFRFVKWPDAEQKEIIKTAIQQQSGFESCIGAGDGCLIKLMSSPTNSDNEYLCRKKFYAVSKKFKYILILILFVILV